MVLEGIASLTTYAQARGVKLGIEPLHPMFTADRSVIATLEQANALADQFPADTVGVVIDTYHVWWDPNVYDSINRAGSRIFAFHVSDWLVPPPDFLKGRGVMGDGCIEFAKLVAAVNRAGYNGPIEVEIFNERLWSLPGDQALSRIKKRFAEFVQRSGNDVSGVTPPFVKICTLRPEIRRGIGVISGSPGVRLDNLDEGACLQEKLLTAGIVLTSLISVG